MQENKMPRYINLDELERMSSEATAIETKAGLMALVKLIPTINIVRCKDCIFSKRDMDVHPDPKILNKDRWCELYGRESPDWFCADGKRRDDE